MAKSSRKAWAFFWLSTGVAAIVTLVAAPGIPSTTAWLLFALAGISFSISAYLFGLLRAPLAIGTPLRTGLILGIVWGGLLVLAYSVRRRPEISFVGLQVFLNQPPNQPIFANVIAENIGAAGNITAYSYSGVALTTTDPKAVARELRENVAKLRVTGGGLVYRLGSQEKKWYTVFGPVLTQEQATALKNGTMSFYFAGTVITSPGDDHYDFCNFVLGNHPGAVLECEVDDSQSR